MTVGSRTPISESPSKGGKTWFRSENYELLCDDVTTPVDSFKVATIKKPANQMMMTDERVGCEMGSFELDMLGIGAAFGQDREGDTRSYPKALFDGLHLQSNA